MVRLLLLVGALATSAVPVSAVEKTVIDRAIGTGVSALRKMQQANGTWKHDKNGATALAGLTLLECGVKKEDKAVQAAARRVRTAALTMTDTYSLSLAILFLDALDNTADTPLIESMTVRLLAGQTSLGGWSYECPPLSANETRRLEVEAETGGPRVLRGGRDLNKLPAKGKRTTADLPKEIRAQLRQIAGGPGGTAGVGSGPDRVIATLGDNSNTQFAVLALWVGRRYGLPTSKALVRADKRARAQQHTDGGWGYMSIPPGTSLPAAAVAAGLTSTATMTCSGLLALAVGQGASLDLKKVKDPKAEQADISKDNRLTRGLTALATAVSRPTGWSGSARPSVEIPKITGKGYYFLWSLERVCLAFNLETLDGKDWYNWGAEALLVSQQGDGSWHGDYGTCGADTCFALLFLKRVNLVRDLSSKLRGGKGLVLRSGGVGGTGLKAGKGLEPTGIGTGSKKPEGGETVKTPSSEEKPKKPEETAASRLADDLVRAGGERRAGLLKELRDTKGAEYTDALAGVIPRLEGAGRREARAALTDRLTRMKATTLREYLKDDDAEVRRAAALAVAQKDSKALAPDLIRLLSDPEPLVQRAAYVALKEVSGKDFGPRPGAGREERSRAIADWLAWWKKEAEK
jgi:hypothetical protein